MNGNKKMAILVAERSGDWNEWIEPLRAQADDIAIVLQRMDESPAQLAARVRDRLQTLSADGELVAAALVGGTECDAATLMARSSMTCFLAARMSANGTGRLFLDASHDDSGGRSRHAMQALASVLEDQVGDGIDIVTAVGSGAPARRAA